MVESHPPICDYEGSDYQQRFWEESDRVYEDRVEAVALRRLLPAAGRRLLELGAGAGRNTPRYRGFGQIVLLDYSRSQLEQAMARLGASERYLYVAADVYRLPFRSAVFDGATMIRTLHHLVDPPLALGQVRDALAAGAWFILEYANKRNLKAILRWLMRRQDWNPFDLQPVEFAELNFNFHPAALRRLLRKAGFEISRTLTVSHFRMGLLKSLIPLGLLVAADALIQWTGALWQLSPSVFLKLRVPGDPVPPLEGAIFRCPNCGSEDLEPVESGLSCRSCESLWELREGIYDFRQPLEGPHTNDNYVK